MSIYIVVATNKKIVASSPLLFSTFFFHEPEKIENIVTSSPLLFSTFFFHEPEKQEAYIVEHAPLRVQETKFTHFVCKTPSLPPRTYKASSRRASTSEALRECAYLAYKSTLLRRGGELAGVLVLG